MSSTRREFQLSSRQPYKESTTGMWLKGQKRWCESSNNYKLISSVHTRLEVSLMSNVQKLPGKLQKHLSPSNESLALLRQYGKITTASTSSLPNNLDKPN